MTRESIHMAFSVSQASINSTGRSSVVASFVDSALIESRSLGYPRVRRRLSYSIHIDTESVMLKRPFILAAIVVSVVLTACSGGAGAASDGDEGVAAETASAVDAQQKAEPEGSFMVQDGDLVEVHYDGTLDDGSTFDSSRDRGTPFSFTVGTGQVIAGFDEAVRGLKVGESRSVRIPAEEAYGEWSQDNVVEVPVGEGQDDVTVGDKVFLNTGQGAVVLEVKDGTVVLDANHELAGKALTFDIEVLSITRP
jgi:FKBP-type peptidyl-prolyl cis-trans isomerase 2